MVLPLRIIIDWSRVILTRVLAVWLGAVAIFRCIDAFENLDDYTKAGASTQEILNYLLLRTPELAFQILPAAVLLGALAGLFHLAKHKELTAAEAAGLNPSWVFAVPLLLGFCLSLLQVAVEAGPLPQLKNYADRYHILRIERDAIKLDQPLRWAVAGPDLWRIATLTEGVYSMERYRFNQGGLEVVKVTDVTAIEKTWRHANAQGFFYNGAMRQFAVSNLQVAFLPQELQRSAAKGEQLGLWQLWRLARAKQHLTGAVSEQALEFHQRLSWCLMNLTVLIAILPFVPRHGRKASAIDGILAALLLGMLGWASIVFGTAFGSSEKQAFGFYLPHLMLVLTGLSRSTKIRAVLRAKT